MHETEVDDFLSHYGVKGMKWGVRRSEPRPDGVSSRVNRDAKKDAREHARAKMFYGEGAGTRRKLIKATVESKSKNPEYKKAFDFHVANQDMGKHAKKAKSERTRKDVTQKTTKTARGVHRRLTGGFGNVSMASAAIAGAYLLARQNGTDKIIMDYAQQSFKVAQTAARNQQSRRAVQEWLKKQNFG